MGCPGPSLSTARSVAPEKDKPVIFLSSMVNTDSGPSYQEIDKDGLPSKTLKQRINS